MIDIAKLSGTRERDREARGRGVSRALGRRYMDEGDIAATLIGRRYTTHSLI